VVWRFAACDIFVCRRVTDRREIAQSKPEPIKDVSVDEFDVCERTELRDFGCSFEREYALGHVPGAVNIDCNEKDFTEKLAALD